MVYLIQKYFCIFQTFVPTLQKCVSSLISSENTVRFKYKHYQIMLQYEIIIMRYAYTGLDRVYSFIVLYSVMQGANKVN